MDILETSWNKLLGSIHRENQKIGDAKTSKIIRAISGVKPNIKRLALEEYLSGAQMVHSIAFLQWRMMYPSHLLFNEDMLREIITERLSFMYDDLESKVPDNRPESESNGVNARFYEKYANVFT